MNLNLTRLPNKLFTQRFQGTCFLCFNFGSWGPGPASLLVFRVYSRYETTCQSCDTLARRGMSYKLWGFSSLGSITTFSLPSSEDVSCLHVHYGFPCVGWEWEWAQG